jgi:hypothetical protein
MCQNWKCLMSYEDELPTAGFQGVSCNWVLPACLVAKDCTESISPTSKCKFFFVSGLLVNMVGKTRDENKLLVVVVRSGWESEQPTEHHLLNQPPSSN